MTVKSPLRYHGGKQQLAAWIISHFPKHTRYVEPYFGGGSVLFAKEPEGVSEFANDIDGDLMNFWDCIASPADYENLARILQATPLSQTAFKRAKSILRGEVTQDDEGLLRAARAAAVFIVCRMSRQGMGGSFVTPTRRTRRGMNEQVSAWLAAIEGMEEVHERLQRVEVRSGDALKLMRELDDEDTLFYLDPPYLLETRSLIKSYKFEMTNDDHKRMWDLIGSLNGSVCLSGYPSAMYDEQAELHGWRRVQRKVVKSSSSKAEKPPAVECLWMNYDEVKTNA